MFEIDRAPVRVFEYPTDEAELNALIARQKSDIAAHKAEAKRREQFDWRVDAYLEMTDAAVAARRALGAVRQSMVDQRPSSILEPRPYDTEFQILAARYHELGWDPIPQSREGKRFPMHGAQHSTWFDRRMTREEVVTLVRYENSWLESRPGKWLSRASDSRPASNTALICKRALFIDIDILDFEYSREAERLIEAILSPTKYKRIGREPKVMLVYILERDLTAEEAALLKKIKTPAGDIEFLSGHALVSVGGSHHLTHKDFVWSTPLCRPSELPPAAIDNLRLARFEIMRRLAPASLRAPKQAAISLEALPASVDGYRAPPAPRDCSDWTRDDSGIVVDGRDKFVLKMMEFVARANLAKDYSEEDRTALLRVAFDAIAPQIARDGLRWGTDAALLSELQKRLASALKLKWETPILPAGAQPKVVTPASPDPFRDADLAFDFVGDARFTPPAPRNVGGVDLPAKVAAVIKGAVLVQADRLDRALMSEAQRRPKHLQIQDLIQTAIGDFMADVVEAICGRYGKADDDSVPPGEGKIGRSPRTILIKAPPGSGKTSGFALGVMRWIERMLADVTWPAGKKVVLYVENYVMARQSLAVIAGAGFRTMSWKDDAEPVRAEGQPMALAALYSSKSEVPCKRAVEMLSLIQAEIEAHGFCERDIKNPQEAIDAGWPKSFIVKCVHKDPDEPREGEEPIEECDFYKQERTMAGAHLMIAVHAMAKMNSRVLHNSTVGVMIDEDPTLGLAKMSYSFDADRMKTREKRENGEDERGLDLAAMYEKRANVNAAVTKAIKARRNPAAAILDMDDGEDCMQAAIDICHPESWVARQLRPDLAAEDIAELVKLPKRLPGRPAEREMWTVIRENVEALKLDPKLAERLDSRLQAVIAERPNKLKTHEAAIRVSRRTSMNKKLLALPIALLDATASEKRVAKALGRRVDPRTVDIMQHVRVLMDPTQNYSVSSFEIGSGDGKVSVVKKLKLRDDVRLLISLLAGLYPWSRGLVVAPKRVRAILNEDKWRAPRNLSWLHHGFVKGQDFAKEYAWVLVVGRNQMTIQAVDASGACFGADEPGFVAVDKRGDGTVDGKTQLHRHNEPVVLRMRTGEDIIVQVPHFAAGSWQRDVDEEAREKQNFQIATRLRTVYRDGDWPAPLWIQLGPFAPADTIIDAVRRLSDMVKGSEIADLARRRGLMTDPAGFADVDNNIRGAQPLRDDARRALAEELLDRGVKRWPELAEDAAMWRQWRCEMRLQYAADVLDSETLRWLRDAACEDKDGDWLWALDERLSAMNADYVVMERPAKKEPEPAPPSTVFAVRRVVIRRPAPLRVAA